MGKAMTEDELIGLMVHDLHGTNRLLDAVVSADVDKLFMRLYSAVLLNRGLAPGHYAWLDDGDEIVSRLVAAGKIEWRAGRLWRVKR